MINLNDEHAYPLLRSICADLLSSARSPLFGCEMGIAYGGGVEKLGKQWLGKGIVFGFDTFTGHPRQLANGDNKAESCMDPWYRRYGTAALSYESIRDKLDSQGLLNVVLVKGLVDENTNIDFVPHLDYTLLDMDFPVSMKNGYRLVRDKIVPGGYLCIHDVVPKGHIDGNWEFYQEVVSEGLFEIIEELPSAYVAILKRRPL